MRHLGSLALALVIAPVALVLAGRGLVGLPEAAAASPTDYFGIAAAGSAVVLAALLYAWLIMARFSPLGPALAGAGYLAFGVWALADPAGLLATVPANPVLTDEQLAAAATLAPLLAVPLLVTLFSPRRWRPRDRAAEPAAEPAAAPYHPPHPPHLPSQTLDDLPRVPAAPPPPPAPMAVPLPPPMPPPPTTAPPPYLPPPAVAAPPYVPSEGPTVVLPSDETTTSLRPTGH